VFRFVFGPAKAGPYDRSYCVEAGVSPARTENREPGTLNHEPNLNTNREART